jgi:hypothetical protein
MPEVPSGPDELTAPARSHIPQVISGLYRAGWSLQAMPPRGRLRRNGQLIELRSAAGHLRLRLFVYKVTSSSRGQARERRIEITSTYRKGLQEQPGYRDVVLGYDTDSGTVVGVDPRRMQHGGRTGNASSFFSPDGLSWHDQTQLLVLPHPALVLPGGLEYQAFFSPNRLAEYLFNIDSIHVGSYNHIGRFAGETGVVTGTFRTRDTPIDAEERLVLEEHKNQTPASAVLLPVHVSTFERQDSSKLRDLRLTPKQLEALLRRAAENGQLGEQFVLRSERKKLAHVGRNDLAARVRWIASETVSAGYDILSFFPDGREKQIEVKATQSSRRVFEISRGEWNAAERLRSTYHIYLVTSVRTRPRIALEIDDPLSWESSGRLTKLSTGWQVTPTIAR